MPKSKTKFRINGYLALIQMDISIHFGVEKVLTSFMHIALSVERSLGVTTVDSYS